MAADNVDADNLDNVPGKEKDPSDQSKDLIWIEDASRRFSRSRDWLSQQVRAGKLTRYKIPGDRRVFVSVKEIRALLQPHASGSQTS